MLTKSQLAILKSIGVDSNAVLSHDHVSGKVSVIAAGHHTPVRFATYLKLIPHLVQVKSGYSSIEHYKAKYMPIK